MSFDKPIKRITIFAFVFDSLSNICIFLYIIKKVTNHLIYACCKASLMLCLDRKKKWKGKKREVYDIIFSLFEIAKTRGVWPLLIS